MPVSTAPGTADGRDGGGGGTCARFLWAHAERSSAASATAKAGVRCIWSDYGTVAPAVLPPVFCGRFARRARRRDQRKRRREGEGFNVSALSKRGPPGGHLTRPPWSSCRRMKSP